MGPKSMHGRRLGEAWGVGAGRKHAAQMVLLRGGASSRREQPGAGRPRPWPLTSVTLTSSLLSKIAALQHRPRLARGHPAALPPPPTLPGLQGRSGAQEAPHFLGLFFTFEASRRCQGLRCVAGGVLTDGHLGKGQHRPGQFPAPPRSAPSEWAPCCRRARAGPPAPVLPLWSFCRPHAAGQVVHAAACCCEGVAEAAGLFGGRGESGRPVLAPLRREVTRGFLGAGSASLGETSGPASAHEFAFIL